MPKIVFLVPEGLLLGVWSSVGLWVGLVCGSRVFTYAMGRIGLVQSFGVLGWVEEIVPTDNSAPAVLTERASDDHRIGVFTTVSNAKFRTLRCQLIGLRSLIGWPV